MAGFEHVLVVCVGNICRSPTAEFLLKRALPGKRVESAGLGALVGHDMEATARLVAEAHGLACPQHKARQLTRELCREADVILVMEARHRDGVTGRSRDPAGAAASCASGRTRPVQTPAPRGTRGGCRRIA